MTEAKAKSNGEGHGFRLDPNRVRTNAEIRLFADVFEISVEEARQILMKVGSNVKTRTFLSITEG